VTDTAVAAAALGVPGAVVDPAIPAGTPAVLPASWFSTADEETRGFLQNKGLDKKDAAAAAFDLVGQYRNLEKLRGVPADRLLTLPADPAVAGAMDPIYERLGRPAKPDGYEMKSEAGDQSSADYVKWASETFHKLGLTKTQATEADKALRAMVADMDTRAQEAEAVAKQASMTELQAEWGNTYATNVELAKAAVRKLAAGEDEINALTAAIGDKAVVKLFQKIGAGLAESPFHAGGPAQSVSGATTPEGAKAKIAELHNDREFTAAYAKEMMEGLRGPRSILMTNLHKLASAGHA